MSNNLRMYINLLENQNILYHGTSLVQFEKMKNNNFKVKNLYLGDDKDNITNFYAEKQAEFDDSYPVTLYIDSRKIQNLEQDVHGSIIQDGQFIFSGSLYDAIIKVEMYDFNNDETIFLDITG